MIELSGGQQTIDAARAELTNLKQYLGEATSVLSTTQWVIATALIVLAIIIGFWVGKDTEVVDESNELERLKNQLQERDSELKDAKDEAELTLLQLHQVQEELEHYFLSSRDGDELAAAQQHQLSRAQTLMGRLLPVAAKSHSNIGESIDVITPDVMSQSHISVQTDALLASYQKSLHRAAALLQRALRS